MYCVRAVLKSEIIKVFSFELPLSLFTSSLFFSSNIFLKGFFFSKKDPVHKTESEGSGSKNKSNMKILQGVLVVALSLAGLTNGEDDGDLRQELINLEDF